MIGSSIEALSQGNARDRALAEILKGVLNARDGKDIPFSTPQLLGRVSAKSETEEKPQTIDPLAIELCHQAYELLGLARMPLLEEKKDLESLGIVFLPVGKRSYEDFMMENGGRILHANRFYHTYEREGNKNLGSTVRKYRFPVAIEIGINPTELFLRESFNKTYVEQLMMVDQYSKVQATRMPDVRAVVLPLVGYAQLDKAYLDKTRQVLIRYGSARALDITSELFAANIGRTSPGHTLEARGSRANRGFLRIGAIPALIFVKSH